jgi:hypothetical protein
MASRANVYIDQGADFRIVIDLTDENDLDLSIGPYSFYSTIRKMYSSTKLVDFTVEKDIPNSSIALTLADNLTTSMKPGKYQYDCIMQKTSGERTKIVEGLAFVVESMTNPADLSAGSLVNAQVGDGEEDFDGNIDGGQY